jgi:RNA polymerase sigma-70 factor (ECF subfamily)
LQVAVLPGATVPDEHDLHVRLLGGDEEAFGQLVDRYYLAMLRVARGFVRTQSAAEEVVQETLLAVVEGLPRFEGRSTLKTWLFRILVNRAKTRGARERRCISFSCLRPHCGRQGHESGPLEHPALPGTASSPVDPAGAALNRELGDVLWAAVDRLPVRHRQVLVLRDVHGCTSAEVCELLGLSDANQRILLHRARTRVRTLLLPYFTQEPAGVGGP